MAELVGAFASSHAPLMARAWNMVDEERLASLTRTFDELGRRIRASRPDVLVLVTPDHWVNFFINNLPSVCICVGEEHDGPPEPWMQDFPLRRLRGHPEFAMYLAQRAFASGFEPSLSHHLELDHGACIPLMKTGIAADPPALVPIVLNTVEPPLISIERCQRWGDFLRESIEAFPGRQRIAIMATGGLSHSIGEADMGRIDEPFDMRCVEVLRSGDTAALRAFLEANIESGGNGAAEIRNWAMVHSAVRGRGFDLIGYHPYPEWYVGCGFASWDFRQ